MLTKVPGKCFFINYAIDITPCCDCYGWTDTPIVNGIGILASPDPVAVDKACIDLMNQEPGLINSEAEDCGALDPGAQKLNMIKGADIEAQIYGGLENGLGTTNYLLKKIALDRSQKTIDTYYPEVRARKLKPMYKRNHPLLNLDTADFGRTTEGVANPKHPKK